MIIYIFWLEYFYKYTQYSMSRTSLSCTQWQACQVGDACGEIQSGAVRSPAVIS